MEQKMTTIPFDLELAKKINNGEYNGTIVTAGGNFRVEFVYYREEGVYPILGVIHTDHGVISDWFSSNGCGARNYRLKLEVPEYLALKDGDIYKTSYGSIGIYNKNYKADSGTTPYYVGFRNSDGTLLFREESTNYGFGILKGCTLNVTEEEKQKLVDALNASKEPKAKEYLKRFFGIEEKLKCEFKPKDWVLCKDGSGTWSLCMFSHTCVRFDGS